MGVTLTKAARTAFEITNELFIAVGSGIWGIAILANHGLKHNRFFGTSIIVSLTIASLLFAFRTNELCMPDRKKFIVITGCDSGLGFSLALHASEMGFSVLAGCLNLESEGACILASHQKQGLICFKLDVTQNQSIENAMQFIHDVLTEDKNNELWCVINNAGVMIFGEFEWLTNNLIQQQINVNLLGTMQVTKAISPLLRKHKSRLINVVSHCALATLPGLAVYGATKAGIYAFSDGIRVELAKYGVRVVSFVPGSFPFQSNIMLKQHDHSEEMRSAFTSEQEKFYGIYFKKYNSYLCAISAMIKQPGKIYMKDLYENFENALIAQNPKALYIVEPMRYKYYHFFFKYSPYFIRDYLVNKFIMMPAFERPEDYTEYDLY